MQLFLQIMRLASASEATALRRSTNVLLLLLCQLDVLFVTHCFKMQNWYRLVLFAVAVVRKEMAVS